MIPPVLKRISFDTLPSFRKSPWLYGIVVVLCFGISALLVFGAWYGLQHRTVGNIFQPSEPIITPGEKNDRLILMNILNSFHLKEGAISKKDSIQARTIAQKEHIQEVIRKLEAAKIEGASSGAQGELLAVFKEWDARLVSASSTADLKPAFVTIAQKYSWLNTLVWLIILNRL
jgi:hypothetical protein